MALVQFYVALCCHMPLFLLVSTKRALFCETLRIPCLTSAPTHFSLRTRVERDTLPRWKGFRGFGFYILLPIELSSYLTEL